MSTTIRRIGVVTGVRYTYGGDGRQRTFIDGIEYATWWDFRTRDWREGDTVAFDAVLGPLWGSSTSDTLMARNIVKVIPSELPRQLDHRVAGVTKEKR